MLRVFLAGVALALAGCATNNPRFQTVTPTTQITGEAVCEVPQHWKALALEGVDTRHLTQATVVQVRIPAEWIGDALGWFVESETDSRVLRHLPRLTWRVLVINERTSKRQLFPAIMKNPLDKPYLTVIMNDPAVIAGQELSVYVLSGAYTKVLTVSGDRIALPQARNCLDGLNAEFLRTFPSKAIARKASDILLDGFHADFPKPGLHTDGKVYSKNRLLLSPEAMGDTRQVTRRERTAARGANIAFVPGEPVVTIASIVINLGVHVLSQGGEYTGPFGERQYSQPEIESALRHRLQEFNRVKCELERRLGHPCSRDFSFRLDFEGRKSGWEIGDLIAPQVEKAWAILDRLEGRIPYHRN